MRLFIYLLAIAGLLTFAACGGGDQQAEQAKPANPNGLTDFQMENGIGPVTEKIAVGEIDKAMAQKGEEAFKAKCAACHKMDERYVAPALRYVTERRTNEWVLNQILNPDENVKKHPLGQKLLGEYLTPMPNQNIAMEEAMQLLHYMRLQAKEGKEQNIVSAPVFKNQN